MVVAHDSVGTSEHGSRTITGIPVEVTMKRLTWVLASVPAFTVAVIVSVADVPRWRRSRCSRPGGGVVRAGTVGVGRHEGRRRKEGCRLP